MITSDDWMVAFSSSTLRLSGIILTVVLSKLLCMMLLNSVRLRGIKKLLRSDAVVFHRRPHRLEVFIYRHHHLGEVRYGFIRFATLVV